MGLTMLLVRDRIFPLAQCDLCGEQVTRNAIVLWRPGESDGAPQEGPIFVHRECRISRPLRGWSSEDLDVWLVGLIESMHLDMNEAQLRVDVANAVHRPATAVRRPANVRAICAIP